MKIATLILCILQIKKVQWSKYDAYLLQSRVPIFTGEIRHSVENTAIFISLAYFFVSNYKDIEAHLVLLDVNHSI